ncbi:MAG: FAD-dependent monooxygenase [Chthoniobacterales bacterium]
MESDTPIPLVVGAGPVGLTMACELARHGVRCRIIDQARERSQTSKALGIFPRTLEVFQTMGLADRFLAAGQRLRGLTVHHGAETLAQVELSTVPSPFPFALSLPQSETERLLLEQLSSLGIQVERETSLTNLEQTSEAVHATLRHADGQLETCTTPWLIGCDGAHSTTRHALGFEFEGAQYDESFILADVRIETSLARDRIQLFLSDDGLLGAFPFGGKRWRIVANIPPESRQESLPEVTLDEVQSLTNRRGMTEARLSDPAWLSRFHISHRKVRDYRKLRVFLAGDAAHIHSPAGGQGMNTGIQDAFNLAWKLALVVRGRAPAQLLASYQAEREPVARGVLNLTDRITRMATMRNSVAQNVRDFLLPMVSRIDLVAEKMAEQLSELKVNYRHSAIVENHGAGRPRAGERAPDAELRDDQGRARRIYELLQTPRHLLLLFLGASGRGPAQAETLASVVGTLTNESVAVYGIARGESGDRADLRDLTGLTHAAYGLTNGGFVLLRPDGYVGYRSDDFESGKFRAYLARTLAP